MYVYPPLEHAEWHGWTPTDLIFPFFLFIVGISISLALARRREEGTTDAGLHIKIFKRSVIIFALGILLHLVPRFDLATLRIPGVLQRIALCYLFAALIYVHSGVKGRSSFAFALLSGYWLVMKFIPVPGYGAGILDYKGNLCAYIDTKLMTGHLYKPDFDPEGILSTFPAIATVLLGTLAGDWLRTNRTILSKAIGLLAGGVVFTLLGLALHPLFPINKQLWTSTFVLFTAGAAMILFAACFIMMDGFGIRRWAYPFLVYGTNPITVFVGASLMARIIGVIRLSAGGEKIGLQACIYKNFLASWANPYVASLLYPAVLLLLWFGIMLPLYRKKIFIKI